MICHVKGVSGRFPHLSTDLPGYCFTILTQAYTKTMPPGSPGSDAAAGQAFRDAWCNSPPNAASEDKGDPHLTTTNNIQYDFQAAGEFVALRNSDSGFELQARQAPVQVTFIPPANPYTGLQSCVSLNTAVAVRLGSHRVTFEPASNRGAEAKRMILRVDGKPTPIPATALSLGAGNTVATAASGTGLDLKDGDGTEVTVLPVFWTDQGYWYLDVQVISTPAREGTMGPVLAGDWLPRGPTGTSFGPRPASLIDRHIVLNHKFADAWRVTATSSLFDYDAGTSTASFTDPNWPPAPGAACRTSLPSNRPLRRMQPELAQSVCRGVKNKKERANCVFDVTVMGDRNAVKGYQ